MATTTNADLDPLFLRAISLLRSKHPDSGRELNQLVQDYREKTYGVSSSGNLKKVTDLSGRKSPHIDSKNTIKHSKVPSAGKTEKPEVSLFDKLEEITNDESSNHSTTVESIEEITVGTSLEPKPKKAKKKINNPAIITEEFGMSPPSDLEANDSIPIDDIIEMDFDGPSCKLCHLNNRSENENSLVECSECHLHYHQKCHKPNVSTKDLNDPRLIWYCSKCTKKMKKEMAAQQSSSSLKVAQTDPLPTPKVVTNPFQQAAKPFRRHLSTSEKSSTNELTPPSAPDSPSSREGSPSPMSNKRPRDVTVSSMKRLEMMKKNAKMQQQLKQASRK